MSGATPGASGPSASGDGSVRPGVACVFATVAYVALLIFGLGMVSLVLDESVIATPGLGHAPGVVSTAASVAGFALALLAVVRRSHPSYAASLGVALTTWLAYLAGLSATLLAGGAGLGSAGAVTGRVAIGWFGVVIAAAALVCAWAGVALVRTRASRPRWSWEDEDDA